MIVATANTDDNMFYIKARTDSLGKQSRFFRPYIEALQTLTLERAATHAGWYIFWLCEKVQGYKMAREKNESKRVARDIQDVQHIIVLCPRVANRPVKKCPIKRMCFMFLWNVNMVRRCNKAKMPSSAINYKRNEISE